MKERPLAKLLLFSALLLTLTQSQLIDFGNGNYATSRDNRFNGKNNFADGYKNSFKGTNNVAQGTFNDIRGNLNVAEGHGNLIHGEGNFVSGEGNMIVSGNQQLPSIDPFQNGFIIPPPTESDLIKRFQPGAAANSFGSPSAQASAKPKNNQPSGIQFKTNNGLGNSDKNSEQNTFNRDNVLPEKSPLNFVPNEGYQTLTNLQNIQKKVEQPSMIVMNLPEQPGNRFTSDAYASQRPSWNGNAYGLSQNQNYWNAPVIPQYQAAPTYQSFSNVYTQPQSQYNQVWYDNQNVFNQPVIQPRVNFQQPAQQTFSNNRYGRGPTIQNPVYTQYQPVQQNQWGFQAGEQNFQSTVQSVYPGYGMVPKQTIITRYY